MTEAYISVPVPAYRPILSVPVPQKGAVPYQGQAQAGVSLVQSNSITTTPSDIAKDSLLKMLELPGNHPARKYDQICKEFVDYLDKCEQKGFMIKGYDTKKGEILNLPMSYNNRWGPVRRVWLADKLKRLEFWFEMQEDRPVTMITLTSYHKEHTIPQAWNALNKGRHNLLSMLGKYLGKIDYFWVPEPHKSGYVHYHIAVFADIPIELENKLRKLWSEKYQIGSHTYGLDFSQKRNKEDKIKHLKNYLSKYLEKGFLLGKWTTGMLLFNAHLWETGFRMYGASENIRKMMNIKEEKKQDIVWLETRMQTMEQTPEGEELEIDKIIWDRQYFPDWIDEPLWYGNGRQIPWDIDWTDAQRLERRKRGVRYYKWGRPTNDTYHGEYDVEPRTPEQWRAYRKQQQDGYL